MSFHLAISTRRDPADRATPSRASSCSSTVAMLEITGVLSQEHSEELRQRLEALLATPAETVVIELTDVGEERERLARFAEWVGEMRAEGKPLHVAAHQRNVYEQLRLLANDPEWLVPYEGSETAVNRRALIVDGPNATS